MYARFHRRRLKKGIVVLCDGGDGRGRRKCNLNANRLPIYRYDDVLAGLENSIEFN